MNRNTATAFATAGLLALSSLILLMAFALAVPNLVAALAQDQATVEVIDPASIGVAENYITPRTRRDNGQVGDFMRSVVAAPESQWFAQSIRIAEDVTTAELQR